ncbi:hypothetical protein EI94DRAFT_1805765 [Lactarius quietus]|nr:hypothetical protein EI94DRAFT_1805765 [Lactarius quietus]
MVKGLPRLSLRGIITAVNAVRRISSEAGRASKDKVARMLTRTVTLFRRPRNRTVVSELTVADWNCSDEVEQHAKIETLPDEILLEIFDCSRLAAAAATESDSNGFYDPPSSAGPTWRSWQWHRLVHNARAVSEIVPHPGISSWNQVVTLATIGSAPRLRDIHLTGIALHALPLLLSSTRDLVSLRLDLISRGGYISPEAFSHGLSTMTQLKSLEIDFLPRALSVFRETGGAGRSLTAHAILPALSTFRFYCDSAYLEDLISRIDAPILERLNKTHFQPDIVHRPISYISLDR